MKYDLPEEVVVTVDGPVRVVNMNRADDLNAVNEGLHRGLAGVWSQLGADDEARSVVVTGAGRAFCAGGDIGWFAEIGANLDLRREVMREAKRVVDEMLACHLPVIAAVNGPAVGFG